MKKFIKHLLLYYSIPFLLYFLFLLPTAITKIILLKKVSNTSDKYMFTPIDESDIYTFKINNIKKNNYDVIAFGSSRVNTFTEEMFTEEVKFYNLCHMGEGNKNIYNLLRLILEYQHPRVIILGIDQWTFNNQWNSSINLINYNQSHLLTETPIINLKKIFSMPLTGKFGNVITYGFNSTKYFTGFKNDGSWYPADYLYDIIFNEKSVIEDYNFSGTRERIENGNERFEWSSAIEKNEIKQIEDIIMICKENNVEIIGFFPPFAPEINKIMNESEKYSYINKNKIEIEKLFKKYNSLFFDFTSIYDFNNGYYSDGFHGNKNVYFHILKEMSIKNNYIKLNIEFENNHIEREINYNYNNTNSFFYSEGKIKRNNHSKYNNLDGNWTCDYYNGQRKADVNYSEGKPDKKWIFYYDNGQIRVVGNYKEGRKKGKWIWYDNNGRETKVEEY